VSSPTEALTAAAQPGDTLRVEAQIDLTEADFLHALQGMPERRFGTAALSVIASMVLVGVGLVNGFDLAVWLSFGLTAVLVVFMNFYTTRLQARRFFNDIDAGRRQTAYVFTPTSLTVTTKNSHVRQDYEALKRYVLTPHTLLLYSSSSIAQIIPLRAFVSGDRERVIAWIRAQVKPSPKVPGALKRTVVVWLMLVVAFAAIWWLLNP